MDCNTNPFGHWGSLDERVQELANRLHAWWISGEMLDEIFSHASMRMDTILEGTEDPLSAPKETFLQALEDALDAYDNILGACQTQ